MSHWSRWLATTPPMLLHLIARSQRISLPRRCTADERLRRIRTALCHARTVRVTYALLDPPTQAALQALRHTPRGIAPAELEQRYGPLRSLNAIAADRAPQSISERLLLMGWLLPRPATHRHPMRYLLPPELRDWLPVPLDSAGHGDTGTGGQAALPLTCPTTAPAEQTAVAVLLAAADRPLPVRLSGAPTVAALARLQPLLTTAAPESAGLLAWLFPILVEAGLLVRRETRLELTPAAAQFLAGAPAERIATLRAAWVASPTPDGWLTALRANCRGLDWPHLRRRLLVWAAATPCADPHESYTQLSAAYGPLGDPQTHGFVFCTRSPWQERGARAVWAAALAGPLAWLGALGSDDQRTGGHGDGGTAETLMHVHTSVIPDSPASTDDTVTGWQGDTVAAETLLWSHARLCKKSPSPPASTSDAYTPSHPGTAVWQLPEVGKVQVPHRSADADLLELLPFARTLIADDHGYCVTLDRPSLAAALCQGHPLDRLAALLSRRADRLPPAWADLLTAPEGKLRLLERVVLVCDTPAVLDRLARRRSVRRYIDDQIAPGIALIAPGRAAALARTLDRHGDALWPEEQPAPSDNDHTGQPPLITPGSIQSALRKAIRDRRAVTIIYATGGDSLPEARIVRPLTLEQRGDHWYLRAYCLRAQAERTFRTDRISALELLRRELPAPAVERREPPASFFPLPSGPVGIWLEG